MSKATVRLADWQHDEAIRMIRQAVFIEEQEVPVVLEWDMEDASATHFLMFLEQQAIPQAMPQPIATARLLPDGKIGRVAVLAEHRRQGFGQMLMLEVMDHAKRMGMSRLTLSAQTHAIDFYGRLGFEACSSIYLDAGIPHQDMSWNAIGTA